MNKTNKIKQLILNQLHEIIDQKIETSKKAIKSAKEARDNDTKSSAGDKYETGRAMMQIELEKSEKQLNNSLNLKQDLSLIDIQKEYKRIEFGSLVITNQGNYFISIGIGKIEVNNENYYAISLASPIGKLLYNKKINDKFQFQEREFIIRNIE
ncbi:MAG: 3-oxoacyl-ACP synthase [Bacteroidota bacterium]